MSEFKLLLDLNTFHVKQISNQVINELIALSGDQYCLSGDDSELTNIWEEICVQVQSEYSYHWDAYCITIDNYIESALEQAPDAVRRLISFVQSIVENADNAEENFAYNEEYAAIAIRNSVMEKAGRYENDAIKSYIYGPDESDEDEDEDDDDNDSDDRELLFRN